MTRLYEQTLHIPGAELGDESTFPSLPGATDLHAAEATSQIPERIAEGLTYGRPTSVLPYTTLDGYDRSREPMQLSSLVLDNGTLRAQILPQLGGRLWSLEHLPTGRQLLYRNPVFQPANLALRNAWFSGGVEWNPSTIGHSPLTCSPMHAALVETDDGPLLRLWEFERLREVPFHVDFMLPDGSEFLYVGVRIVNPHLDQVPMYWWSNIAVPQRENTRVLAPATRSYRFSYGDGLGVIPTPVHDGNDYSFPAHAPAAADYFFDIQPDTPPWIAAIDGDGNGLLHASTSRLQGRKLFVWGQGRGGQHWQKWLTEPGGEQYLEIQAGLAQTQLEHLRMPPATSWSWMEAYGPVTADTTKTHGPDWREATATIAQDVSARIGMDALARRYTRWQRHCRSEPDQILHSGSGWGALEQQRRRACGEPLIDEPGMPFSDTTVSAVQRPWQRFLSDGDLAQPHFPHPPAAFVTGPAWRHLLYEADFTNDWHGLYQRGLAASANDDRAGAYAAWLASCEAKENPWALRCLAAEDSARAGDESDPSAAAALWSCAVTRYQRAVEMLPHEWRLLSEAAGVAIAANRPSEALDLVTSAPSHVRAHGRVRLQQLRAAIDTGDVDTAQGIFESDFEVVDLREGEVSLDELWFDLAALRLANGEPVTADIRQRARRKYPLPKRFDFRMHD